MTTVDFITELFCRVDDKMLDAKKHAQAKLYPSEVVTLALLFALKGVGTRPFYRWLERDYLSLFPSLPVRTRLLRLFKSHRRWIERFMAEPTLLGVVDTYGIELIHPRREGRSPKQIGRKGGLQHALDRRGQAVSASEPMGLDCRLELRHRQRVRWFGLSTPRG